MQRRALSPVGIRRQRLGRKVLASSRMMTSIERKLPAQSHAKPQKNKKSFPVGISYRFRRRHAIAAVVIVVVAIGGMFGYGQMQHAQAVAKQKKAEEQQKIDVAAAEKRQQCYQSIVKANPKAATTMTYDQLYGNKCQ